MKTFLAVLVAALAATSAWLWHSLNEQKKVGGTVAVQANVNETAVEVEVPNFQPGIAAVDASADIDHPGSNDQSRRNTRLIFAGTDPRLARNDDYRMARDRYLRAAFEQRYPDLSRVLGIPEETAFQVVELSHEERLREAGIAVDSTKPGFWQEQAQKAYESDAAIAALVGDAKLRAFKDYEDSIGERYRVKELRMRLLDSPEPMSLEKSESLIGALFRERKQIEAELQATRGATGGDPAGPTIEIGDDPEHVQAETEQRLLKIAKKELSSYQFEVFREMVEREGATQAALEDMLRIGSELLNDD